jgi:hypothetical protein
MRFELIKSKERLKQKRQYLKEKYPYALGSFGKVVSYEMPVVIGPPFPKLAEYLREGSYPREFSGIEYYIGTNNGYLERIVPAAEYYKLAFRTIREQLHSLKTAKDRIDMFVSEINRCYQETRTVRTSTGQSAFKVQKYVYDIKSELGNFFFVSRSVLDTTATLMHFLYGPRSKHYGSFTNFIKQTLRDASPDQDVEMRQYFQSKCEWYYRLKDVRDYITHYKSLDVSFYEQPDTSIHIYLENRFKLDELVEDVYFGIKEFLRFTDEHFTKLLQNNASSTPLRN